MLDPIHMILTRLTKLVKRFEHPSLHTISLLNMVYEHEDNYIQPKLLTSYCVLSHISTLTIQVEHQTLNITHLLNELK